MLNTHLRRSVEFYLGLRPERDEIASSLADLALYAKRQNVIVDHGHTISAEKPFWTNTEMHHFLVSRSSAPLLDPIELENDIHVEFLQVTPIFESELRYKKKHQAEGLLDLWESRHVAFGIRVAVQSPRTAKRQARRSRSRLPDKGHLTADSH